MILEVLLNGFPNFLNIFTFNEEVVRGVIFTFAKFTILNFLFKWSVSIEASFTIEISPLVAVVSDSQRSFLFAVIEEAFYCFIS